MLDRGAKILPRFVDRIAGPQHALDALRLTCGQQDALT